MAPNASDDDKADKTQFGVAHAPQLKRPPHAESDGLAEPKVTDAPHPPPIVSVAPAAEPTGPAPDSTHPGGAAPPIPKLPPAGHKPPPPEPAAAERTSRGSVAPPPTAVDDEEEGTVIVTRKQATAATLQRLQPPGHPEVIHLDRTSYLVGRSHKCDLALYSPTASREHARLTFRDAAWHLQPLGDKPVIADGNKVGGELRLTHKMRLQLGGDELLFFHESAAVAPPVTAPAVPSSVGRLVTILVVVAVGATLAVAAWWLLSHGSRLP